MNPYTVLWAQWGILNDKQYQMVLREFGSLEIAWKNIGHSFLCQLGFNPTKSGRLLEIKKRLDFETIFKKIEKYQMNVMSMDDPQYPQALKSIDNPPPFLFIRGKLPLLHKAIGVVGTRKITDYGQLVTETLVRQLAQNQFVIISGLAMGIDTCAHKTTLLNQGKTIAVLGSGVDEIYPKTNESLGQQILNQKGVILSEYPIGTKPMKHHFPARNRIISGLSRGTIIMEGGIKSGALITARYALEQGREVFAVPNNITKKELSGTNHLIRRGEAKLIEKVEHILEEFQMTPQVKAGQPIEFSQIESEIIEIITNEGKTMDELIQKTPYNIARLSVILIELQLKGVVREINRKWTII